MFRSGMEPRPYGKHGSVGCGFHAAPLMLTILVLTKDEKMKRNYVVILCGLFIAMQVVLGRVIAIDVGFMRISFGFIPIALGGAIFGPFWNGIICAAADIAGFLTVPSQYPFFPGFTLSAFLSGFAYGFFLNVPLASRAADGKPHNHHPIPPRAADGKPHDRFPQPFGTWFMKDMAAHSPISCNLSARSLLIRISLAAFCVTILIDAFLTTYWVSIIYKNAYLFYFWTRLIKSAIMLPIHVAVFGALWRYLGKYIATTIYQKHAV